jgi:hypothetical protein
MDASLVATVTLHFLAGATDTVARLSRSRTWAAARPEARAGEERKSHAQAHKRKLQ